VSPLAPPYDRVRAALASGAKPVSHLYCQRSVSLLMQAEPAHIAGFGLRVLADQSVYALAAHQPLRACWSDRRRDHLITNGFRRRGQRFDGSIGALMTVHWATATVPLRPLVCIHRAILHPVPCRPLISLTAHLLIP